MTAELRRENRKSRLDEGAPAVSRIIIAASVVAYVQQQARRVGATERQRRTQKDYSSTSDW